MKRLHALTAIAVGVLQTQQVLAYVQPVAVTGSVPIETQVMPAMGGLQATLAEILTTETQIGTAIVQASDKQVAVISEAARAQREADIFGRQTERLERAREQYSVADSICSESASGVAATVGKVSRAQTAVLASGAGVGSAVVQKTIASEPVASRQGGYRSAAMHAQYCTQSESAQYGGTDLCPQVSSLPGGDIEMRSLIDGAGAVGKAPDLTFNQDQVDAGMAYMKNSARHDGGRAPGKGDIQSATGREYQGLITQYKAIQSAATQPQLDIIAASQANPATQEALQEALQNPSAAEYFASTGSQQAQRTGVMSEREFEAFEVGRRYANTAYETDLQALSGDNLMRELVRVQSLGNWLQLGLKNDQRQANIIAGQQLALAADAKYVPQLQELGAKMSSGVTAHEN
ncbi:conjugal transfer protein TraW [Pseudomonas amygdali]|uniref:conjugal transfer protein TraW n=1 Tax=Pseudomonas amygdali TaxID=47877 RepID=UPI0007605113|nr:conjugal transfer protein TraW [Pseudomonas amygdali]KWT07156.1 conjugal transfer protein [Pseudomonas amygdali pv. aesculi]KWT20102.1 conjugal transfer protein [Pseudomonas amygdali pv. aesculi]UNO28766.1 conjugal transfer protein TraW [Pseudomonas amygdali pv. aesculi]WGQ03673.1 conjugal transfer protein TraW [Pseudomonas amygdali pv. aesculi]